MSEQRYRFPLLIDSEAFVIGVYVVTDADLQIVREFDTAEEAEAFVAEANGSDVATVREATATRRRMLAEYRANLKRGSRLHS